MHGPATDEPLVQYEGAGTSDRRWLHADERGSVVATSDAAGNLLAINRYDEFGKPQATNQGRFQYTGQMWLPEVGLYYYKARFYAPHLGRFMQTDPIGYEDGINWYAYVRNDPVNLSDPSGQDVWLPISDPVSLQRQRYHSVRQLGHSCGREILLRSRQEGRRLCGTG